MPATVNRSGVSARATVARLRRVDRCHLWRAGGVHGYHGSERVAASETLGGVTQRAKELELGTIVVVGAGVVVDVGLLQLLQRRDDLLRAVHQLQQLPGTDRLAQSFQVAFVRR